MTSLDISSNRIGDDGAAALASALKAPSCKLTFLNASDNDLSDDGWFSTGGKKTLQQAAGSR